MIAWSASFIFNYLKFNITNSSLFSMAADIAWATLDSAVSIKPEPNFIARNIISDAKVLNIFNSIGWER